MALSRAQSILPNIFSSQFRGTRETLRSSLMDRYNRMGALQERIVVWVPASSAAYRLAQVVHGRYQKDELTKCAGWRRTAPTCTFCQLILVYRPSSSSLPFLT